MPDAGSKGSTIPKMPSYLTRHTFSQGYHDIVNEKIASAIAKLEEAGLTPEACEKFLKTYGKVIDCQLGQNFIALITSDCQNN